MKVLIAIVVLVSVGYAATKPVFVITNDDNPVANTATVYSFNTTRGTLKRVKVLQTGGVGLNFGFFEMQSQAVQHNDNCIFVMDNATDDIAAFQGPAGKYKKVGNFVDVNMDTARNGLGGSIALSPDGNFLYEGASGSENVGAWKVNSDCSLSFIAAYNPRVGADTYSMIRVTPDGKKVIVPAPDLGAAEVFSINQKTGELTDLGFQTWGKLSVCKAGGCFPSGLDVSPDSKVVFFGNPSSGLIESGLTATVRSTGLANPAEWDFTNSAGVQNITMPVVSPTCTATSKSCLIFWAGSGFFSFTQPEQPGIVTTTFTEKPLKLTVTQSTAIGSAIDFQLISNIALVGPTGNWLILVQGPDNILVYPVDKNGKLGKLASATTDTNAIQLTSLSVF